MKRIAIKIIVIAAFLGSMALVNWTRPAPIGANWNTADATPVAVNWSR